MDQMYTIMRVEQRARGALRIILINGATGGVIGMLYVEKILINPDVDTEQYIQGMDELEQE